MFSFRVRDALINQQLDAMGDRSSFIRRAVTEKLSADTNDEDAVLRLRAGLASIAKSSALILHAGGDDVPELVRVGLIGIGEAAAILAADDQNGAETGGAVDGHLEPSADTIIGSTEPDLEALPRYASGDDTGSVSDAVEERTSTPDTRSLSAPEPPLSPPDP